MNTTNFPYTTPSQHVLVLFGGCSSEYDVSLQSAHAVLTHINTLRYHIIPVGITREGNWLYYQGSFDDLLNDTWHTHDCTRCTLDVSRDHAGLLLFHEKGKGQCTITRQTIDLAFPVLHGKNGEDGTIQGLLELAGIRLVGCGVLASALCMDKVRSHQLAAFHGIKIAKSLSFNKHDELETILDQLHDFVYPLFVKPVKAGSSFGITKCFTPHQVTSAIETAFEYDDEIIIEENIEGVEVGCAVLGTNHCIVGEVDEIELQQGFFDYTEKYNLITSQIHLPARFDEETREKIKQTALQLYRICGCRGFARVDLFITPEKELVFNEINTIPGFTGHSRYPSMMKSIGLSFEGLIDVLLQGEEKV